MSEVSMIVQSSIGNALFTKTQRQILGLLYGKPDQSYYLNQIVRKADMGKGTIKRELESMCNAGLLTVTRLGNQVHYQANATNPIFHELKSITQKTFGVAGTVHFVLEPILPSVELAFIYGSIASGAENADSDVDVMLVANDLSYGEIIDLLTPAEKQLARTINPTIYTRNEFSERINSNQNFVTKVMNKPKIWLKGEDVG